MIPDHVCPGNPPQKIHMCVQAYRGKEGLSRVNGFVWVYQTQKKGLEGAQYIIAGNHVRGNMNSKMVRSSFEHHRVFRVFVEAQKVLQAAHMKKKTRQQTRKKQQTKSINKQIHRQLESDQNAKPT